MKYHNHEIRKVLEDLGFPDERDNYLYNIYKDGRFINVAASVNSAKDYIDNDYNENYL